MSYIQKCALVPSRFYVEKESWCILSDLYPLQASETVSSVAIPEYEAVMVYTEDGDRRPELYHLLCSLSRCKEYNKILFSFKDGALSLAIGSGGRLLLANVYPAADFATAEYWIFLAMKSLQLNPEVSSITTMSALSQEEEMSLYRYFKAVETLK